MMRKGELQICNITPNSWTKAENDAFRRHTADPSLYLKSGGPICRQTSDGRASNAVVKTTARWRGGDDDDDAVTGSL